MDVDELVKQWRTAVRIGHRAHTDAAARWEQAARLLGVSAIAMATVVGTVILATMHASPGPTTKAVAGLVVIAVAVLACLQTFLGVPDRAQRHRDAAVRYAQLRRDLDELAALPEAPAKLKRRLEDVRERWKELESLAPAISARQQGRARDLVLGTREK